jgi:hypothetical protein
MASSAVVAALLEKGCVKNNEKHSKRIAGKIKNDTPLLVINI